MSVDVFINAPSPGPPNVSYTTQAQSHDWRAAPLEAPSLANVAPAVVITAEFDPLRDEVRDGARVLCRAEQLPRGPGMGIEGGRAHARALPCARIVIAVEP